LNGELGLSQVFLFGERSATLTVQPTADSKATTVTIGGDAEATTTTEHEREQRRVEVPSWTAAEYTVWRQPWFSSRSAHLQRWPKTKRRGKSL
jgi:hypothetical protein